MSKLLIHMPVFFALILACACLIIGIMYPIYLLLIPGWQAFSAGIMLIIDGGNREKRFTKLLRLLRAGKKIDHIPMERTICGFFIMKAVLIEFTSRRCREDNQSFGGRYEKKLRI